jgi:hypothetical protein
MFYSKKEKEKIINLFAKDGEIVCEASKWMQMLCEGYVCMIEDWASSWQVQT